MSVIISGSKRKRKVSPRVSELVTQQDGMRPEWVRPPSIGPEHYSGFSRAKLYDLAKAGKIRSVSIREPGQIKGTRLFHLRSILDFIEACEVAQ